MEASAYRQSENAQQLRRRLFDPPNAVADQGIDLKRKPEPVVQMFHVGPQTIPTSTLNPSRHLGTAVLRGQAPLDAKAPQPVTVALITAATAEHFKVTVDDILSVRRTANVVLPRQIVAYLSRHMTLMTLPAIGRRIGGRDHTTILSSVRKIERLCERDEAFAQTVNAVRQKIMSITNG